MKYGDSSKVYKISFLALLGAFIIMRAYVASPWTFIAMDEAVYLALARRFPGHILYNLSFYTTHPPLYPYLVHITQYFSGNFAAGMGISLICSVISFFLLNRLFRLMGKPPSRRLSALGLFTLSLIHIEYSHQIMREATIFCFFLAGLTFAWDYLLGGPLRWAFFCGLSGLALVGTSHEHGLSFIIIMGIGWVIFRKKDIRGLLAMTALPLLAWTGWLVLRIYHIKEYPYLPIGPDGIIQATGDLKFWQLFNPGWYPTVSYTIDIPAWSANPGVRFYFLRMQFLRLLFFAYTLNVQWIAFLIFFLCLGKCLFPKKNNSTDSERYFFLAILCITLLPIFLTNHTRYSMPALIPIFYFLSEGFWEFIGRGKLRGVLQKVLPVAVLAASLPSAVHWVSKYPYLSLKTKVEVENHRTAGFLKRLGPGGVMAQYGYPPELAYLTDRRVVGMPPTPKELDRILDIFDIRYIVLGDHYWSPVERGKNVICIQTIRYIMENPVKFPLVALVEEEYRSRNWPDTVRIYEVRSDPE